MNENEVCIKSKQFFSKYTALIFSITKAILSLRIAYK